MSLGGTNLGLGGEGIIILEVVNAAVIVKKIEIISPPPIEISITIECP